MILYKFYFEVIIFFDVKIDKCICINLVKLNVYFIIKIYNLKYLFGIFFIYLIFIF